MSYDSWKMASPPWYDLPEIEQHCTECQEPIDEEIAGQEKCLPCFVETNEYCTSKEAAKRYTRRYKGTIEPSEDYPHNYIFDLLDKDGELVRYVVD